MRSFVLIVLLGIFLVADANVAFAATRSEALIAAMKASEEQYGLPTGVLSKVARIESAGREDARNSLTDAAGMFQWIPRSWYDATRRFYGQPRNLSDRYDGFIAVEVTALAFREFLSLNRGIMQQAGADPLPGLYACHFLGPAGCRKLFSLMIQYRDDPRPASMWFPKEARYNPQMFNGVTIMGFYNRLAEKMRAPGITGVVNGGAAFDGPLVGRIMDQNSLAALNRPFAGPVPGPSGFYSYPSTFTAADANIPADSQSNTAQQTTPLSNSTQSALHIIAQPKTVSRGDVALISWTSVGMKANSCRVTSADGTMQVANEGSNRVTIPSGTTGVTTYKLECTNRLDAVVASEATVQVQ